MDKITEFTQIYQQYIDKIYRFVYLKVNFKEAAEDITSKVFLKCWESYNGDNKINNINAFLYKTANNAVIDYYRENSKKNTVSSDYMGQFADPRINFSEKLALSADAEKVKKAIKSLKKEYQDILIWHYLEDMPIKEIVQLTGKSDSNVRVMAYRAMKKLRKNLEA